MVSFQSLDTSCSSSAHDIEYQSSLISSNVTGCLLSRKMPLSYWILLGLVMHCAHMLRIGLSILRHWTGDQRGMQSQDGSQMVVKMRKMRARLRPTVIASAHILSMEKCMILIYEQIFKTVKQYGTTTYHYYQIYLTKMIYLRFNQHNVMIIRDHPQNQALIIPYDHLDPQQAQLPLPKTYQTYVALLGVQILDIGAFLVLVEEVAEIATVGMSAVYQIKKVVYLPIAPKAVHQEWLSEAKDDIQALQLVFAHGLHYYSDQYDLSLPLTVRQQGVPSAQVRTYYDQFIWNHNIVGIDGRASQAQRSLMAQYCPIIIQGYIANFSVSLPSKNNFRYCLISRRSTRHAGTRFYARGITPQGAVANYVETEQIGFLADRVFTHLQIRGSVPAFFAQTGVNGIASDLIIQRNSTLTKLPFRRHYQQVKRMYERAFSINLLSNAKQQEKKLTLFYQQMIDEMSLPYLRYHYYDFHRECHGDRFDNSQQLINQLGDISDAFGCNTIKDGNLIIRQNGVFRTNCLDCLDRTNYVQSRLALRALRTWLRQQPQCVNSIDEGLLEMPVKESCKILALFNGVWADNGDAISLHYTDIPSTHTDITRTGQRTFSGSVGHKMRSLRRFYTQFTDQKKHSAVKSLVTPSRQPKRQYPLTDPYLMLFLSYDCETSPQQARKWIHFYGTRHRPALIVVLASGRREDNFLGKVKGAFRDEKDRLNKWQEAVGKEAAHEGYVEIKNVMGSLCWMGIYCIQLIAGGLGEVREDDVSQGGKGDVLLARIGLWESTLALAGVNFGDVEDFVGTVDDWHHKAFQTSKLGLFRGGKIQQCDLRVIIGWTGSYVHKDQQQIAGLQKRYQDSRFRHNDRQAQHVLQLIGRRNALPMGNSQQIRNYKQAINVSGVPEGNRVLFSCEEKAVRVVQYKMLQGRGVVGLLECKVNKSNISHYV